MFHVKHLLGFVLVLYTASLTVPLSHAFESFSSKPRIGERGDRFIPGEPWPSPGQSWYERQRESERLEELEDSLYRIERRQEEIQRLQRLDRINEFLLRERMPRRIDEFPFRR